MMVRSPASGTMVKVSQGVLGDEELEFVRQAFAYGYFGMAHFVADLERDLAAYLGAPHVLTVNTGTAALHVALDALGIGAGDEVVIPSLTFVGAFQAISATGATPVPCDVRLDTLLIDLDDVEQRITPRTRAVVPVHYAGNPCDLDRLHEIAEGRGLRVVEDAAHAFGSFYKGRKIGSFGDVVCFSFDSIKNMTCGEGGAVVCRDGDLVEVIRQKRAVGIDRGSSAGRGLSYEVRTQGYRYHMSNINGAIGLVQLRKVDAFIARRREICRRYDAAFIGLPGVATLPVDYAQVAPHIYVLRIAGGRRDAAMAYLRRHGIETGINYIPNHLQPLYRNGVSLPATERAHGEILTLPLHCALSNDDVERVIDAATAFFRLPS